MAHKICKSQIAILEMNGQSVPQRWTSMREGSNTARRQCSAWDVELSAIRRAKILASRQSGYRVAHQGIDGYRVTSSPVPSHGDT